MYILKKKEFWIGIVVMAVLVVGSVVAIGNHTQVDAADPGNCKNGDISGSIGGSGATVHNNSDHTCTVGLAVFKINGPSLDDQELYANDEKDFNPGKTIGLGVSLPPCDYQIDLYAGNFPGSAHFSSEHLIDSQTVTGRCNNPTPTPVPTPTNHLPLAFLDVADCTDVRGWARDPDSDPTSATSNASLRIHIYNGPAQVGAANFLAEVIANVPREPQVGNHAFVWTIPASLKDGRVLNFYVYAIDIQNPNASTLAYASPKTVNTAQCIPPTPTPTPVLPLACSPATQQTQSGVASGFISASGAQIGSNESGVYAWSTTTSGAILSSQFGDRVTVTYSNTTGSPVTVPVTVHFGNQPTATCNVVVSPAPVPAINLSATAGTLTCPGVQVTSTVLNWSSTNNSANTTYTIRRKPSNASSYTVIATGISGTSYSDAPQGSQWSYLVSGVNAQGVEYVTSNEVAVNVALPNCPVSTPLSCSPSSQTTNTHTNVILTATGGTGSYVWTASSDANPTTATGVSFTTSFSNSGGKTVTVASGSQIATCNVTVNAPQTPALSCSASRTSANVNDIVAFSATGGTNAPSSYRWNMADGFPQNATGASLVNAIFSTSGTKNVIVTDGSQTATCPVTIQAVVTPPPTSTAVSCFPLNQTITSGGIATLLASGGTGIYSWSAPNGDPSQGFYRDFSTRYTPALSTTYQVTVQSGGNNATCTVQVQSGIIPPPTSGAMSIQKLGRNITQGQAVESAAVSVHSNDTVEFLIHVRALSSSLSNIVVTDLLPQGITYIPHTTSVNNVVVQDGVTGGGINIGSLAFGQEAIVRFSALVAPGTTFPTGTMSVINTAYGRADNVPTLSSELPVSRTSLGVVAGVQTGPGESLLLALLVSGLMTFGYMQYTGTSLFNRRDAVAKVRQYLGNSERLNFMRFLR